MSNQPFDYYKNKDVEYDFILSASVNLGETSEEVLPEIISFIKDEDLLAMYFDKIALGRVYPKVEYLNGKLYFTFGISLVDTKERPTSKDLIKNINNFILSLNKNLEDKDIKIKEGDIKVEVITENKSNFDNIDKVLVSENNLYFSRGNDIQRFKLTDDGIVEKYLNENLQETFPFSKLGLSRECKTLVTEGYTLTMKLNEANITNTTATSSSEDDKLDISDPEKTKQDLQQNIKDVEEIQDLKNELDDKMANLMEESIKPNEKFPSTDFSSEPILYQDLDVETFNKELTPEQKAYINTYLGTIEEFVDAMLLLYNEVGNGVDPMISIDDYVEELLNDNGITEWSQELADMLGFDLKTEGKEFDNIEKEVRKIASDKGLDTSDKAINAIMKDIKDNFYNGSDTYGDGDINEDKIRNIIIPAMDTYYGVKVGDSLTENLSHGDLGKLANDIIDWYGADMGTYFDEIKGNEEEVYAETLGYLENKDVDMINHFIDDITLGTDTDDEELKAISEDLVNRLKQLLDTTEVKTESKSKFYTADKMFDDFLKTAKEEAEEDGYTFKLSDLGLTREDSADFKNLLLQRDEIEDVSYDPQNNTYTVKITGVETEEKPVDNNEDEK